ncbi:MAG: hypothetical protein ACO4AU_14350, partial [bacterium]
MRVLLTSALLLLLGCSDGELQNLRECKTTEECQALLTSETDSSDEDSDEDSDDVSRLSGRFLDSAVEGIDYASGNTTGTTDGAGTFEYEVGREVAFSIGGVDLGSASGGETVTPVDLVPDGDTDSDAVVNIARFLQTLDADGDPSNGITVPEAVKNALQQQSTSVDFSVDPDDFESRNSGALNAVKAVPLDNGSSRTVKSKEEAQAHLEETRDRIEQGVSDLVSPWNGSGSFVDNITTIVTVSLQLSAVDDTGVSGWYASENATKPGLDAAGWHNVSPARKNFSATESF